MTTLLDNRFVKVQLDEARNLLWLEWLPSTADMSEEDYKTILMQLADFVSEHQVKYWLGDTLHFTYVIVPALQEWTAKTFNTRLATTGLQKMALIIPRELIANLSVEQTTDDMEATDMGKFTVKYFDNTESAVQWLTP
ncbi:hypothetical protein [Rhodoflexus caldus]|uniref:hypothetical protein n=1 Tax=Rhodoflexus caldus TaxID=2891236 RepID=UPI002029EF78|nr:hypothetical protein [Rhodoflexus caldus]